jgi:hypothetical protein
VGTFSPGPFKIRGYQRDQKETAESQVRHLPHATHSATHSVPRVPDS